MDELHSEIREAFEKEQAAHPPTVSLRRNVVQAVAAHPRPAPNLQWVAVAAAVLLGLGVVAGLMSSRLAHRPAVPGNSKATPLADYGPPPAGVPLLYVHDPNNPLWLIGYDWSGTPRGTVKLPGPLGAGESIDMAPDGQQFQVKGGKGGSGIFLDRLGQQLPGAPQPVGFAGAIWADDSRHLCSTSLNPQNNVWFLSWQLPTQAAQLWAIAQDPNVGQTAINVVACSFTNNVAILVRTTIASPSEIWVVRLSDGKVLSHHTYKANLLANVFASRDGAYIAENPAALEPNATPGNAAVIRIRRVSDWTQVATVGASMVFGFSGDDSLVLLDNPQAGHPFILSVENWASGSALWNDQGTAVGVAIVVEPGGRDFALALFDATDAGPDPMATILIVHGDGSVTKFPRLYEPAW